MTGGAVAGQSMVFSGNHLSALVVASCFAAGLNVYATVATLGILARTHTLELPPSLDMVTSWWVIGACVTLYAIEFVADKIPAIDLVWNALQTFVRVPVAALLAYAAAGQLSPPEQLLTSILGGGVALVAHGGKTAARMAVTPSPEPFSNIALSLGEDALAVFIVWLASRHPYWSAGIAAVLMVIIFLLAKAVLRAIRTVFGGARRQLESTSA
jgi:hypothetical protein